MNDIAQLFFELILIALGTRICLSRTPNESEWGELYKMAKKQSLVGVCFAGVQRLQQQRQEPPEMLYLTWMGMAAKIQQRNELMKAKGDRLLSELRNDGMEACILKGQTVASLYKISLDSINHKPLSINLQMLRQSGDIDVWVKNMTVMELDAYVRGVGLTPHTTAAHVSYDDKDGVEIELHAEPAFMRNFRANRKLVKWFKGFNGSMLEFNLVYMMVHMYHHVLFEGLGLRQLMDYYFVLCTSYDNDTLHYDNDNWISIMKSLGMLKYAKGIMWIMKEVFALEDKYMICEANEKYGRMILEDVMNGGNFGHHGADIQNLHSDSAVGRSLNGLKRNMKFFWLGPTEILSSPVWSLWHWWWRKKRGLL